MFYVFTSHYTVAVLTNSAQNSGLVNVHFLFWLSNCDSRNHPSSLCLQVYLLTVTRWRTGKNVTVANNINYKCNKKNCWTRRFLCSPCRIKKSRRIGLPRNSCYRCCEPTVWQTQVPHAAMLRFRVQASPILCENWALTSAQNYATTNLSSFVLLLRFHLSL